MYRRRCGKTKSVKTIALPIRSLDPSLFAQLIPPTQTYKDLIPPRPPLVRGEFVGAASVAKGLSILTSPLYKGGLRGVVSSWIFRIV